MSGPTNFDSRFTTNDNHEEEQRWTRVEGNIRQTEQQRIKSPVRNPFSLPFVKVIPAARCLDECLIIEISNSIRSKPHWQSKYKNEEISKKWIKEIKDQCQDKTKYIDQIIEYIFEELEWYERVERDWVLSKLAVMI